MKYIQITWNKYQSAMLQEASWLESTLHTKPKTNEKYFNISYAVTPYIMHKSCTVLGCCLLICTISDTQFSEIKCGIKDFLLLVDPTYLCFHLRLSEV